MLAFVLYSFMKRPGFVTYCYDREHMWCSVNDVFIVNCILSTICIDQ
jgi:hypothetical protein